MPIVTVAPVINDTDEVLRTFTDSVGTSPVTYTYRVKQEKITVTNKGTSHLILTVGVMMYTIPPNQSRIVITPFTEFIIYSTNGTQSFEAISDEVEYNTDSTQQEQEIFTKIKDHSNQLGILSQNKKDNFFGYNMGDALRKYRADLAESDSRIVHVAYLGDSIVYGTNATDPLLKSAPARLRKILQDKYGSCGEGIIDVTDSRWIKTGSWTSTSGSGIGGRNISANGGGSANQLSITLTGIAFDIIYAKGNTGNAGITVSVDGVNQTSINSYDSYVHFGNVAHYSGFSNASHTIVITAPANGTVWIEGIIAYTADTGVVVHRLGVPSTRTSNWIAPYQTAGGLNTLGVSLVICDLGVNDCGGAVPISTFYQNLKTLVQSWATANPSVILQINNIGTSIPNWASYIPTYYQIADELNCAVFSVYDKWGRSYTIADLLGLYGPSHDVIHPGDKGYYDIALGLAKHVD